MNFIKTSFPLIVLLFFLCVISNAQEQRNLNLLNGIKNIDYSDLNNWAAHPQKKDPSDSVPRKLNKDIESPIADVFFIHPTTLTDEKKVEWNASLDDSDLNKKTDLSSILYQASVFNNVCRIYAPRYRQTHIKSFYTDSSIVRPYFNIAYNDVRNAFTYFLAHYYKGGPLIIAGHSQGALHAK